MLTEKYVGYLKNNAGLSENTVNSYKYDIEGFLSYCDTETEKAMTKECVTAYMVYMKKQGKSMATVLRCISSIKSFGKYLEVNGIIEKNPCDEITLPKQEQKSETVRATSREISMLLSCIKKDSVKGMRDYAMICLVASSGIQASEITELNIENYNSSEKLIEVMKNGCRQFYPLPDDVCDAIECYILQCRPLIIADDECSLFVNTNGRRMTRQGFWKIIRMYREKALLNTSVTPRTLRYSMNG